jgi:hypothetical protein
MPDLTPRMIIEYLESNCCNQPESAVELHDLADALGTSVSAIKRSIRNHPRLRIWQEVWVDEAQEVK